jgi:hypothetical protein
MPSVVLGQNMIKTVHIAEFSTDDFMTFIGKGGACQEYAGGPGAGHPLRGGAHAHHSQRLQGGCGQYICTSLWGSLHRSKKAPMPTTVGAFKVGAVNICTSSWGPLDCSKEAPVPNTVSAFKVGVVDICTSPWGPSNCCKEAPMPTAVSAIKVGVVDICSSPWGPSNCVHANCRQHPYGECSRYMYTTVSVYKGLYMY